MSWFTIDSIIYSDVKIVQPINGFRFSIDSPLLYQFVRKKAGIKNILDIGSGSGILSVLLLKKFSKAQIDAVEIDNLMFECLCKTVEINSLSDSVMPYHGDIFKFKPSKKYDLVVCNPPYRKIGTGRLCKEDRENIARFNESMNIEDLMDYVSKVLKNRGLFYLSYDADMLVDIISFGREKRLEPKRIRFLHSSLEKQARLAFVEFILGGGAELRIEPPLIQKSEEFENLLKSK
ncbi:tRNA1(Val) (adenine(37)-N6)-methyltransferase [Deferribacter abyssi]|uniref:tRNA1(Val) (adenine(37)-N6)-methyltransferase n=1 Tax=Deferribacter abyssi TaxID=213806 RepID=UPI003C28E825